MKKKSTYQCTVKDKHIGIPFHDLNFHIFHVGMAEENIRARSVYQRNLRDICIFRSRILLATCFSLDKGSMRSGFPFTLHNQMLFCD